MKFAHNQVNADASTRRANHPPPFACNPLPPPFLANLSHPPPTHTVNPTEVAVDGCVVAGCAVGVVDRSGGSHPAAEIARGVDAHGVPSRCQTVDHGVDGANIFWREGK